MKIGIATIKDHLLLLLGLLGRERVGGGTPGCLGLELTLDLQQVLPLLVEHLRAARA